MISGSGLSFVFGFFFFRNSYDLKTSEMHVLYKKNNVLCTIYLIKTFSYKHRKKRYIVMRFICWIMEGISKQAVSLKFRSDMHYLEDFKTWDHMQGYTIQKRGEGHFSLILFTVLDLLLQVDIRCRPSSVNIFSRTTESISNRFGLQHLRIRRQ